MSRWRPSPGEERWLEVASELGAAVPPAAVAERTGGWRSTGLLARIALFVLGIVAAALTFGILGVGSKANLLVAGLIAVLAAEWLIVSKRMHASGIEEGLCVAGSLMIGAWITTLIEGGPRLAGGSVDTLVLIAAVAAAGLRLLESPRHHRRRACVRLLGGVDHDCSCARPDDWRRYDGSHARLRARGARACAGRAGIPQAIA